MVIYCMKYFQIAGDNIVNYDAIISLIDFTDDIPSLVDLLLELNSYKDINVFQKKSILNYIKDRISIIQNAQLLQDNEYSSSSTSSYGGKVKSFLPNGQKPRTHRQVDPTFDKDRGIIGQKAAFIAKALLLAGIGLTVIMYALLAYANVIK